jgi:hypothetical protein
MEIINIEKLDGHKRIVLTGRDENVRTISEYLKARLYYCPRYRDYFEDYPIIANHLQESLAHEDGIVVVTTQSKEFLDCLLESDFDFILATVRKNDWEDDIYRLRVVTKEYALECREGWNMEFRR